MAFNLNIPNNAFRLTPQEAGYGDYGQAFHQGMLDFGKEQESINTPKKLAEALLAQHLQNMINKPKAEHAEEITMADLQAKQVGTQYKNELMKGLPTLNDLRRQQAARLKFKLDNPLLGAAGDAGQIAAAIYLGQHPELNSGLSNNGQMPAGGGQSFPAMQQPSVPAQGSQGMPQYAQPNALATDDQSSFIPAINQQQDMQQPMQLDMNYPNANMQQPAHQQQQQENKTYSQRILEGMVERHAKNKAQSDYQQKRANAFAYATAPVDAKSYLLAQAAGMGINPDKAVDAFASGKTIQDLAKENGFDPNNLPEPDFMPTKGNVTKLKDRQAALAEMNVLSDKVQKGIGQYASTVAGWSPKQLLDYAGRLNKDKQIDFYAARGIMPELTNMRLLASGAKGTVHAIKSMQDKALFNIKGLQSGMSPEVWQGVQQKMDDWISEAMGKSVKAYGLKGKENLSNQNSSQTQTSAPKIPASVTNQKQFQSWLKTLTPAEQMALKKEHVGG